MTKEIQRVENNRFSQRDRENSVHKDLREGAGIAADGRGHSQTR